MSALKLSVLKTREYDLWSMRMEQYLTFTDHALWEVIVNGDSVSSVASASTEGPIPLAEKKLARKNELKAKSTFMLAIPDEHLLKFHACKDAKSLWEVIKNSQEGLDKTHDRFQKLISQLKIHGEVISQEDANLKLLRSLPSPWNNIALIMRNKTDIDTLSMDDLYNNLKVYESEIKSQSSSSSNSLNLAFVSSDNSSSTNETVNTAHSVSAASSKDQASTGSYADEAEEELINFALMLENALKEKEELKLKLDKFETSSKNLTKLINIQISAIDKTGFSYDNQVNESVVLNNVVDSCESNGDDNQVNDRFKKGEGYHAVPPPYTMNYMPPRADLSFVGLDNYVFKSKESDSKDENVFEPKEVKKTVKHSLEKIEFVNARNTIVENENKAEKPSKFSQSPRAAVLTKSGQVPINANKQSSQRAATLVSAARHVNNAVSRTTMNNALPTTYSYFKAHSPVRRPFNQKSTTKTNNFNEKVNTVKVNNVTTTGTKAVVSAAGGNRNNAVKSSTCWIWRPKGKLIDHISKDSGSYTLKRFKYVDSQGRLKSVMAWIPMRKSYLTDYQEINGGFVAFGENAKRGKITGKGKIRNGKLNFKDVYFVKELKFNLFSVSQMCDKKNSVLLTDSECVVLSLEFKLLDESQVLLKVPRNNNMYSFDLKNVVSIGGLTCLFAKATLDESNLWQKRLGHINFKTINKLMRGNLARGLPLNIFENDHTCVACQKGKQHKAYCIQNQMDHKVKTIRCDNGTEFKNRIMNEFCEIKGNQTNGNAGTKANINAGQGGKKTIPGPQYVLLPLLTTDSQGLKSSEDKLAGDAGKKSIKVLRKENGVQDPAKEGDKKDQEKHEEIEYKGMSLKVCLDKTRMLMATGCSLLMFTPVSAAGSTYVYLGGSIPINDATLPNADLLTDPLMPDLEDTADLQDFGILSGAYDDEVEGKHAIGTKWVYRNKKDERGIVVKNKARLVAQGYTQEEGIDYNEVFAPVARIEAIMLFLAYASFMGFIMYQMDVKSAFLYGTIEEEVIDAQEVSDMFYGGAHFLLRVAVKTISTLIETNKALLKDEEVEDVDVHLYRSMIGSLMYLTASRPDIIFQVTPKISHLYAVKRIFRYLKGQPKLGLWYPRDSPFDLEAFSDSDYAGASLDKKSITGGCQFLRKRLILWQCKKQTVVANSTTKVEYASAKAKNVNGEAQIQALVDKKKVIITEASIRRDLRFEDEGGVDCLSNEVITEQLTLMGSTMASAIICLAINKKFNFSKYIFDNKVKHFDGGVKFLMYPRFVQVFLNNQVEGIDRHSVIFVISPYTKKLFANIKREGKDFSRKVTSLFATMMVQAPKDMGEGLKRLRKVGTASKIESSIGASLGHQEDVSKQGRIIDSTDQDVEITLVVETQGRMNEEDMFRVNDLDGDEVIVDVIAGENVEQSAKDAEKEVSTADPVTTAEIKATKSKAITTATTTITAAGTRPKAKGIVMQEPSERSTPTPIDSSQKPSQAKDKGKGKMVEPEKPLKRKDQIMIDERLEKGSDKAVEDNKKAKEGSSKRARSNLEQEDVKRQRLEEENESAEHKRCLEIIPDDDDVTIEATPLSFKSPTNVDYKIYKEGKKSYFKIIRADGNS
nr:hypothetical protein [Tanacetum cinerariifolium]